MNLEAFADRFQEGDRELAAKMFAKLFQAGEDERAVIRIRMQQFVRMEIEPEAFEQTQDSFSGGCIQESCIPRINCVQRDPDRDGLAVTDFEFRNLFQLVGGPMSEVQRAG